MAVAVSACLLIGTGFWLAQVWIVHFLARRKSWPVPLRNAIMWFALIGWAFVLAALAEQGVLHRLSPLL